MGGWWEKGVERRRRLGLSLWCGLCGYTTHTPRAQKSLKECLSPSAFYGNHYDA